jgi:hypothetical protein
MKLQIISHKQHYIPNIDSIYIKRNYIYIKNLTNNDLYLFFLIFTFTSSHSSFFLSTLFIYFYLVRFNIWKYFFSPTFIIFFSFLFFVSFFTFVSLFSSVSLTSFSCSFSFCCSFTCSISLFSVLSGVFSSENFFNCFFNFFISLSFSVICFLNSSFSFINFSLSFFSVILIKDSIFFGNSLSIDLNSLFFLFKSVLSVFTISSLFDDYYIKELQ